MAKSEKGFWRTRFGFKYDAFQLILTAVVVFISLLGFYYAYQITQYTFMGVSNFLIFVGAVNFIMLEVLLLMAVLLYDIRKKVVEK
ncbi:MAG TPA: hypothetical protein ENN60_02590 [archaeon]|nr:hypothetical protein [archaeon]